ncbi:hypothetical protein Phum_PHUM039410 [Pediculus humanus corporis]|uniref:Uncharacterized protein n=1 Tax=Pediculus humanus subsp. corporis TaxID=121224 RepID=E0VAJ0_PEDHC|nr:uncharacterized protein Phum_PHUM039410 [Pediculus humanus corporis]EEB10396.1 hypothetical protein Phum_PHUM039410 [Pediculus humanus corporis]
MPFNEGTKSFAKTSMSDNEMKNSVKNHFRIINNFVSDEENDFPNVHYSRSRVKKFLDHKRIKKRAQFPVTLEAKEAAMSNILDPNLNLDGILEPHITGLTGTWKLIQELLNQVVKTFGTFP